MWLWLKLSSQGGPAYPLSVAMLFCHLLDVQHWPSDVMPRSVRAVQNFLVLHLGIGPSILPSRTACHCHHPFSVAKIWKVLWPVMQRTWCINAQRFCDHPLGIDTSILLAFELKIWGNDLLSSFWFRQRVIAALASDVMPRLALEDLISSAQRFCGHPLGFYTSILLPLSTSWGNDLPLSF